jgi:hypothetical protein
MKAMEHINKTVTYLLDGISGTTLLYGYINGQGILMILGGLASLMAILNHGSQYLERKKTKNK